MSNEAESEILQPGFVIHHHKLQHFLPRLKRQIQSTGEGGKREVKVKSMPYQLENTNEEDVYAAVEADKLYASKRQTLPPLGRTLETQACQRGSTNGCLPFYSSFFFFSPLKQFLHRFQHPTQWESASPNH